MVLLNKMDKESILQKEELEKLSGFPVLPISAKEGRGMEELGQKLEELFYTGSLSFSTETYIHSEKADCSIGRSQVRFGIGFGGNSS